jgi:iron complex outermembrane receptor protein
LLLAANQSGSDMRKIFKAIAAGAGLLFIAESTAAARDAEALGDLSLQDLMAVEVEITSVARRGQSVKDAAAAIFVLSNADIVRSGATTIPDLLRYVPGVHVGHVNGHASAVSVRGLSGSLSNKLLVMIDGRTVYTPLFAGTVWSKEDPPLEDIERIEVIRGPGGSVWGANAFNGVINIITKSARETLGSYAQARAGNEDKVAFEARHGFKVAEDSAVRLYGKLERRDAARSTAGAGDEDDWDAARVGARGDFALHDGQKLTLDGSLYTQRYSEISTVPVLTAPFSRIVEDRYQDKGGHALLRWASADAAPVNHNAQFFLNHDQFLDQRVTTADVEYGAQFKPFDGHLMQFGFGYRHTWDETQTIAVGGFTPIKQDYHRFSAFLQDAIALFDDQVELILGARLEHNAFSGFEVQPNIRARWSIDDRQTVWASAARAVRTPSRLDQDAVSDISVLPTAPVPTLLQFRGDPDFKSEELLAFDVGYRVQPLDSVSIDIAAFYYDYDHLRAQVVGAPELQLGAPVPHAVVPINLASQLAAETYGGEVAAEWFVDRDWKTSAGYSYAEINVDPTLGGQNPQARDVFKSPEHQVFARTGFSLFDALDVDVGVRFASRLRQDQIGDYVAADARVAWRPADGIELSISAQNLFHDNEPEFLSETPQTPRSNVQTSVFGQLRIQF